MVLQHLTGAREFLGAYLNGMRRKISADCHRLDVKHFVTFLRNVQKKIRERQIRSSQAVLKANSDLDFEFSSDIQDQNQRPFRKHPNSSKRKIKFQKS